MDRPVDIAQPPEGPSEAVVGLGIVVRDQNINRGPAPGSPKHGQQFGPLDRFTQVRCCPERGRQMAIISRRHDDHRKGARLWIAAQLVEDVPAIDLVGQPNIQHDDIR